MAGSRAASRCLSGIAILPLSECAAAVVLEVCPTGGCAYTTIKTAVTAASDGDSVLLHDGLYVGTNNVNINYHGKSITVASLSGNPEACIIDCESELYGGRRGFAFEMGEGPGAVLAGVTIRNGLMRGGGICCAGSSPRILNCVLEGNRTAGDWEHSFGGGLMCNQASPVIEGCVFIGNTAGEYGGGIACVQSAAQVSGCRFSGNSARYGGGIACWDAAVEIRGCEFTGNEATGGGAVHAYSDNGSLIDACAIHENNGYIGAGLHLDWAASVQVSNCSIVGNVASLGGGGIRCDDTEAIIRSCLIAGNSAAQYGGGISTYYDSASIEDCTIVGNFAGLRAAGLGTASVGVVSLRRSIVAFNVGSPGVEGTGATVVDCTDVYGHELGNYGGELGDQTGINGNISADPLFCDLAGADYTLDGESPCLPAHNDCGVQMGVYGQGCGPTDAAALAAAGIALGANYPNPFNPGTTIPFSLDSPASVRVSVLDVTGRLITTLASEQQYPAGQHQLHWYGLDAAGRAMPSGVYFYRLETPEGATARPMLLVKQVAMLMRVKLSIAVLGVLLSAEASAATLTVQADGLGQFPTLQAAIDAAAVGDTVLAMPGTYTGTGNKDLDFQGKDIALIGTGGAEQTIVDCEASGRGLRFLQGETNAARVQGLTIIHGYVAEGRGGGVWCQWGAPTLEDLVIRQCYARYTGGICLADSAPAVIRDCVLEENSASRTGGGISLCNGSNATLINVTIRGNTVDHYGGGAYICYSSPRFYTTSFVENVSPSLGGGVFCLGSNAEFYDCRFLGNNAAWEGGALFSGGPALIVERCTFYGNWADQLGGAVSLEEDWGSVFTDCLIEHNTAGAGGALYVGEYSGYPPSQFSNVTMVGNQSWWAAGSAVTANWGGRVDLVACLLVGNFGGEAVWVDQGATIDVACCDLWDNPVGNYGGGMADQTGINGNLSEAPLFCGPDERDYTLADSSPCLPENNDCGMQIGAFGVGCTLTGIEPVALPGITLSANYPNPFNPSTTIPFSLGAPTAVTLTIHDLSGRLVRVLAEGRSFPSGHHELRWDGLDAAGEPAPSGVYFYRLETPAGATAHPMLLVK